MCVICNEVRYWTTDHKSIHAAEYMQMWMKIKCIMCLVKKDDIGRVESALSVDMLDFQGGD